MDMIEIRCEACRGTGYGYEDPEWGHEVCSHCSGEGVKLVSKEVWERNKR